MSTFQDRSNRIIRLTDERQTHLETAHPEMRNQLPRIADTLKEPEKVLRSRTDPQVELFYKWYPTSPVTSKFLCGVVKAIPHAPFMLTAYYTDTVKQGVLLWEKT